MGTEKGGAKVGGGSGGGGGLFNLFDWKRKPRKKLFSISPEGAKLVKRSEEPLPSGHLHLNDEDEIGVSSFKGSADYSCASSLTDEEGHEMKAPGVVARLMGLDAMPSSGVPEPYCTPFRDTRIFRDSHTLKRSPEYAANGHFSHVSRRAPKMPSSPIERFQLEALPPRSAKHLAMSHHRLLSPIKNTGFSSARNAAQIMEAAAKILEPRPQVNSREKICSFSPSRMPFGVSDSRQPQSSQTTVELQDVRFSRGQHMNQLWNSEEDIVMPSIDSYVINNLGCSKSTKGKSVSLALQAKVNVQKREGLSASGRNSEQKQRDEFGANQLYSSQPNHPKNKQQKKSSSSCTPSPVLKQNNQKQNSMASRGKITPNKLVSSQQGRKVATGDSSSGRIKNGRVSKVGGRKDIVESISGDREGSLSHNRDFPQKKRLIERNSTNEKGRFVREKTVDRLQKQVKPNVVMDEHIKWNNEIKDSTDVVSFTFTSPLVKPSGGTSRLAVKWDTSNNISLDAGREKDDSDKKVEGLSSVGLNFVNGDTLSLLLEKKLKELTLKHDPSINVIRGMEPTLDEELTSSCSKWGTESVVFDFSPSEVQSSQCADNCQSAHSSTKGQILRCSKLKVEEAKECRSVSNTRKKRDHEDLSPVSVLEPTFLSESSWSSECSGSSDGGKVYPSSSEEVKNIPRNFLTNPLSVDTEAKAIDNYDISDVTQCSKKSGRTEMEYIGEILSTVNQTADELGSLLVNQDRLALDPVLFDNLENMSLYTHGNEPLDQRGYRLLLFDCVNECLEMRLLTYFRAGYAAWSKGVTALKRGIQTEVCNEIGSWKRMSDWLEDELVDKDMSSGQGTWVDFPVEAFEAGEEAGSEILSSLLDEVIGDLCVRRQ